MRLLTFSVLKNCRLKPGGARAASAGRCEPAGEERTPQSALLHFPAAAWAAHGVLEARVRADLRVLPDFASESEEEALLGELEPRLRRMRYEYDHWDNAIHGYRETERDEWGLEGGAVLARVRAAAFSTRADGEPLPHAHVLDLAAGGHIKPHVDAVRFCGPVIAGLCLCSSAVMRLAHSEHAHLTVDALLPRRALYIMRGCARYEFSHAVLGGEESEFCGRRVARARRVTVICRSRPTEPAD